MTTLKEIREYYQGTATGQDIDAAMTAAKADDLTTLNRILAKHAGSTTLGAVTYCIKQALPRRAEPSPPKSTGDADLADLQSLIGCLGELVAAL